MKKLPIGIQSFSELIDKNFLYIDKTQYLHSLINEGKVYFLSRPRRFGKSLTVSTLKEIFSGNKELFKGLYIYDKIEWEKHPIIHIDFSKIDYKRKTLEEGIINQFHKIAKENSIQLEEKTAKEIFTELIEKLSADKQVVILIDEYDKPIIDYLTETKKAVEHREILKYIYSCLKSLDSNIRLLFLTGVSKFSKVSIFSDLNHVKDISLAEDYAEMFGYTKDEISLYFKPYLEVIKNRNSWNDEKLLAEMETYYNGYSWNLNKGKVYNPFSVLNYFADKEFRNYWFSTGTPTFIIKFLKNLKTLPEKIENILVGEVFFDKFEVENIDIYSLMFQSGYLTIKEKKRDRFYSLGFPNKEVKISFFEQLLEVYSNKQLSETSGTVGKLFFALEDNDWKEIVKQFNFLFSSIPYQLFKQESEFYYHSIIHVSLALIGVDIQSEMQTSIGRIDTVIKNDNFVFVVEFKMGSAEEAIQQIKEKEYFKPYLNEKRQVFIVGIGFDKEKKEISSFITEEVK